MVAWDAGRDRSPLQRAARLRPRRLLGRLRGGARRRAGGGGHLLRPPPLGDAAARSSAATAASLCPTATSRRPPARPADGRRPAAGGRRRGRRAARRALRLGHDHPFPTCFGCGPDRDPADALCLFTGPVGDGRFAVPWTPPAWTGDGVVEPGSLWAALDCPSSAPVHGTISAPVVLGRLTVALEGPVEVGAPHVIQSWLERSDGRKRHRRRAVHRRRRAPRRRPRRLDRARQPLGAASRPPRTRGAERSAAMVDESATSTSRAGRRPSATPEEPPRRPAVRRAVGGQAAPGGRRRQRLDERACEIKRMRRPGGARARPRPRARRAGGARARPRLRRRAARHRPKAARRAADVRARRLRAVPDYNGNPYARSGARRRSRAPAAQRSVQRCAPRTSSRRRRRAVRELQPARSSDGSTVSSSAVGPALPPRARRPSPRPAGAQRALAAVQDARRPCRSRSELDHEQRGREHVERDGPRPARPLPAGQHSAISGSPCSPSQSSASSACSSLAELERVADLAAGRREQPVERAAALVAQVGVGRRASRRRRAASAMAAPVPPRSGMNPHGSRRRRAAGRPRGVAEHSSTPLTRSGATSTPPSASAPTSGAGSDQPAVTMIRSYGPLGGAAPSPVTTAPAPARLAGRPLRTSMPPRGAAPRRPPAGARRS